MRSIIKKSIVFILTIAIIIISASVISSNVSKAGNTAHPWDPWAAVYNMVDYINYNPEVSQYFRSTGKTWDANDVWNHFLTIGMKKGLRASHEFDVKVYMQKYPDLVAVYGNDLPKYYQHYALVGKAEGRNCLAEAVGNTNWGAARNAAVKAKCDSYRATNGGQDCDVYGYVPHLIGRMIGINEGVNYDDKISAQGGYYDVELAKATYKYMAEKYGYSTTEMRPICSYYAVRAKELHCCYFDHCSYMCDISYEIILKTSTMDASPEAIERLFYNSPSHRELMAEGMNYCSIYIYGDTMYVALR